MCRIQTLREKPMLSGHFWLAKVCTRNCRCTIQHSIWCSLSSQQEVVSRLLFSLMALSAHVTPGLFPVPTNSTGLCYILQFGLCPIDVSHCGQSVGERVPSANTLSRSYRVLTACVRLLCLC